METNISICGSLNAQQILPHAAKWALATLLRTGTDQVRSRPASRRQAEEDGNAGRAKAHLSTSQNNHADRNLT
jgi:hypothetical protein